MIEEEGEEEEGEEEEGEEHGEERREKRREYIQVYNTVCVCVSAAAMENIAYISTANKPYRTIYIKVYVAVNCKR